jgi:hypothetical protein
LDGIQVNDRTYNFLIDILTPTAALANGDWAEFATDPSTLNWASSDPNQYSQRIQDALAGGATRTFGSTELSQGQIDTLHGMGQGSAPTNGYVEEIIGSGGIVFLMTEDQFIYARDEL